MTYWDAYEQGVSLLSEAGIADAKSDVRLLLSHVAQLSWHDWLTNPRQELDPYIESAYLKALQERAKRIPVQYILKSQEFMGLVFQINRTTLIPRPETELLVEEIQKHIKPNMSVLDLCTGSGCILISLLFHEKTCRGLGVDASEEALEIARINARNLIPQAKIQFACMDLYGTLSDHYDIIVSNPPYIHTAELDNLMPEVIEHEPRMALDGGVDGLTFYRRILSEGKRFFHAGTKLFLEIGYHQGPAVTQLLCEAGFTQVTLKKDYAGLDRMVYGQWS
ncbi:MAG: peptide chain release factor N(5)-glutamine methyltransferase [Clostridium sp.]|jgi:release factor glutamine methyltransferase|nr:peptide chain release factor N(5)-glutamine methyltransferase [Clostridium sp.]